MPALEDQIAEGERRHARAPRSPLLSPEELAAFLGVPLATVYRWRTRREGPVGFKVGRHVRYRMTEVESWLESRRDVEPTLPHLRGR